MHRLWQATSNALLQKNCSQTCSKWHPIRVWDNPSGYPTWWQEQWPKSCRKSPLPREYSHISLAKFPKKYVSIVENAGSICNLPVRSCTHNALIESNVVWRNETEIGYIFWSGFKKAENALNVKYFSHALTCTLPCLISWGVKFMFCGFEDNISNFKRHFQTLNNIIFSASYFFLPQLINVCTLRQLYPYPTLYQKFTKTIRQKCRLHQLSRIITGKNLEYKWV